MRNLFIGIWRGLTFPFRLLFQILVFLFNAVAFPFRAFHRRFPRVFPFFWRALSFPFVALYRRFPKFFNGLWKILSFPFRLIFNILAFPFRAFRRFHEFLNYEPPESALVDSIAGIISDQKFREQMWAHVEELRAHLIRAVIALSIGVGVSFLFTQDIIEYLAQPVGGLQNLKAIEVTETIGVFMRVAMFSGIALAVPYIVFEMWLFAAPGLRPTERKLGLAGIPLAALFFMGGAAFTFYVMLPAALPFLTNFFGVKTELRPESYFTFVTGLMFWIGLFFEFPLVIYVLSVIGLIEPKMLSQQWRLAIVFITVIAAAVTPTIDPINQGLVMAPMILLYFLSIGLSQIAYAGRQRRAQQQEEQE